MNRAPVDLAKDLKELERRRRQLVRAVAALRQAIDVLREHEAYASPGRPPRRTNGRPRTDEDPLADAVSS